MTLDLIEQVAALRGQVRALESEWDDMRAQISKGYRRMEKAYERLEAPCEETEGMHVLDVGEGPEAPGRSFADKLKMLKT